MSPSSREINGPRPAPLKIHKDSHQIQKHSSSTTTTTSSPTSGHHHHQQQRQQQPVIIYTHSPKVIHTQARDFMALVQKLTGLHRETDDDEKTEEKPNTKPASGTTKAQEPASEAEASSVSALGFEMPSGFFSGEMPLFTPGSADNFYCSPRSLYRFSSPEAKQAYPDF